MAGKGSNIIDYLKWRGDLPLDRVPFNNVDNLVLSYLSYVAMEDMAPRPGQEGKTLSELSHEFFAVHDIEQLRKERSFIKDAPLVLEALADTVRFGDAVIRNCVTELDTEKEIQFAAMELLLGDGSSYIAFRGTDGSIVGWKEDFNMTTRVIPSAEAALEYVDTYGREASGALRIGGHSKGGNLSVYAAALCEQSVQDKIIAVYDNDGPGFGEEFLGGEEYGRIRARIHRIIPACSIIGTLMDHDVEPMYVHSTEAGIMEHDGLSWQVLGNDFVAAEGLTAFADVVSESLDEWIGDIAEDERTRMVIDLFAVLEVTGAQTLDELTRVPLKKVGSMLKQAIQMDEETKNELERFIRILAQKSVQNVKDNVKDKWSI